MFRQMPSFKVVSLEHLEIDFKPAWKDKGWLNYICYLGPKKFIKRCIIRAKPISSIWLSVTSNSSNNWQRSPISTKASGGTILHDSILREVSEGQNLVMLSIEVHVIFRQHVMSNFFKSLCASATKERHSSVTPEHLLKLNPWREVCKLPMAFNPEHVTRQPSKVSDCNPEKYWKYFPRSAVT